MANSVELKTNELLTPIINSLGYTIYDIEYQKEGKDYYLRIVIDKEDGITIDDCEKVSNSINDVLDEADYIKEQYYLEVSSPGLERKLTKDWHLEKYIGYTVEAKLFTAVNKVKNIVGALKEFDESTITIELDTEEIKLDRKNISVIKTVYDFEKMEYKK